MIDVVIIGAGPGGFDTAIYAKEQGLDVTLIENHKVGGTCLNYGCIPTKALYHNAKHIKDAKTLDVFGLKNVSFDINFETIKTRKETIVKNQIGNIEQTLQKLGVNLIYGTAQIISDHEVQVNDEVISTKHIIIATGSSVKRIPFDGNDVPIIHDSKDILTLEEIPKNLLIVGGGVIGMEMASIYNQFGSDVTVVEFQKDILPMLDKDIKKRARNLYKRQGISIHTNAALTSVVEDGKTYKALVDVKGKIKEFETDYVLLSTGRKPNFGGLNLDQLGISYHQQGIQVNAFKQTSIPNIYAIGDVNGELMLAHKATYDGYAAIDHIINKKNAIDFSLVPSIVFSFPEIAVVGKTEAELEGTTYRTNKYLFKTNAKAECMNETDGFVKMIVDEDDILVGCHIIGIHASDLIHEVTGLMNQRITITQYKDIIHAHPTISEVIGECIKGL